MISRPVCMHVTTLNLSQRRLTELHGTMGRIPTSPSCNSHPRNAVNSPYLPFTNPGTRSRPDVKRTLYHGTKRGVLCKTGRIINAVSLGEHTSTVYPTVLLVKLRNTRGRSVWRLSSPRLYPIRVCMHLRAWHSFEYCPVSRSPLYKLSSGLRI